MKSLSSNKTQSVGLPEVNLYNKKTAKTPGGGLLGSIFILPCLSSDTHNLQPVFLRNYDTKGGSLCQAFLAETVKTGNKNRCVTEATHVLRRKLRKD